jgi:hypothetical protein
VSAFDLQRLHITLESYCEHKDIEYVVVVPSKDLTSLAFLDSNGKVKIVEDNSEGIYQAMNLGSDAANGDYLLFLNSGDKIHDKQALHALSDLLVKVKPDWAITDAVFENNSNQILSEETLQGFVLNDVNAFISHQTVVIRKEIFFRLGGYSHRLKVAADTELISKLILNSKPLFYRKKVVFVETPNFSSKFNKRARLEILRISLHTLSGDMRRKAIRNHLVKEFWYLKSKFLRIGGH